MRTMWIVAMVFMVGSVVAQDKRVNVQNILERAEDAYNSGQYAEALSLTDQCIRENPGYADAYRVRAATREQLKDLQGANTDYNIYLSLKPDQPEVLYSLALLQYKMGLYLQARENLLRLLKVPPGETNTIYFRQSASASSTNQITTAQSAIKPQLFNYLGLVETKLNNYKAAIHWLDSAISLQPRDADYYVNRGVAKEGIKDSTAYSDYQRALQINPSHPLALHNVAVWKRKAGGSQESLDQLEMAIESDSSMLYPYLERAYQRMEGGYYKGALADYNKALEIHDQDPEIWLNRGLVKEKLNDLKGAFADYTKAITLDEKFAKAWLSRGNVLTKQGRYKEADEDYTSAITYNPDYSSAYYNRAIARQKLKLPTEACQDLQKAETLGQEVSEKMKKEICKE